MGGSRPRAGGRAFSPNPTTRSTSAPKGVLGNRIHLEGSADPCGACQAPRLVEMGPIERDLFQGRIQERHLEICGKKSKKVAGCWPPFAQIRVLEDLRSPRAGGVSWQGVIRLLFLQRAGPAPGWSPGPQAVVTRAVQPSPLGSPVGSRDGWGPRCARPPSIGSPPPALLEKIRDREGIASTVCAVNPGGREPPAFVPGRETPDESGERRPEGFFGIKTGFEPRLSGCPWRFASSPTSQTADDPPALSGPWRKTPHRLRAEEPARRPFPGTSRIDPSGSHPTEKRIGRDGPSLASEGPLSVSRGMRPRQA